MEKKQQFNFWYFLIALWGVLLFQSYFGPASRQADISYSQFESYLEGGRIRRIAIDEQYIRGEFTQPIDGKSTFITPRLEPALADKLVQYDVEFTGVIRNTFVANLISWVAPAAIFLAMWLFVFRKMADRQGLGGMMNIGKTNTRVLVEKNTGVTFDDVAGVDEAKEELQEIVEFPKEPRGLWAARRAHAQGRAAGRAARYRQDLIARAVAGEAKVPFFSISGSEFVEMFVGVGAARVRDLFEQARGARAPAIIFIDELDALGAPAASDPSWRWHDERSRR
jgi:cell division protease FtsH